MKERPILFSAPMVRAILDGRKTQTRRVVKPQPERCELTGFVYADKRGTRWATGLGFDENATRKNFTHRCPYGQPGDRLWVRESFQPILTDGKEHGERGINYRTGAGYEIVYAATDQVVEWVDQDGDVSSACKPSIHMPRWASRITLEITGVRVERLQDISAIDAVAEGVMDWATGPSSPQQDYRALWESINGPGSWTENPWVWVVEFKHAAQQGEGE